jgi:hypothetical protein
LAALSLRELAYCLAFDVLNPIARDAKRELPGVGAVFVEEAAGGAVVGLLREANNGDCALFDDLGAGVAVEISCGEAGADGIDFDLRVTQFPGEVHGEHVQRGFGSVIAEGLDGVKRRGWIAVDPDGAKAAGDLDDAGALGGSKQWQKRLRELDGAEEVRIEGSLHRVD